jgi:hypothetical protein
MLELQEMTLVDGQSPNSHLYHMYGLFPRISRTETYSPNS